MALASPLEFMPPVATGTPVETPLPPTEPGKEAASTVLVWLTPLALESRAVTVVKTVAPVVVTVEILPDLVVDSGIPAIVAERSPDEVEDPDVPPRVMVNKWVTVVRATLEESAVVELRLEPTEVGVVDALPVTVVSTTVVITVWRMVVVPLVTWRVVVTVAVERELWLPEVVEIACGVEAKMVTVTVLGGRHTPVELASAETMADVVVVVVVLSDAWLEGSI